MTARQHFNSFDLTGTTPGIRGRFFVIFNDEKKGNSETENVSSALSRRVGNPRATNLLTLNCWRWKLFWRGLNPSCPLESKPHAAQAAAAN
ncbi:hypothetical protein Rfer_4332 (plasmid) [Rhodoferax ferrireducens T118]|uniref:Uncharacterized protein n=1 Tax=Albidiferax ferrireducens (strain ATCC BAA-621 / DSM 15236 / T118) TaxID=338969 RepID=Q21QC7_ALBFT|nr:hypothetical protein [Rhodoferax ferrireducens]ABD72018.1 hypothetical protein Rfer_4332 [Rhodoferax ferrireducens T118]